MTKSYGGRLEKNILCHFCSVFAAANELGYEFFRDEESVNIDLDNDPDENDYIAFYEPAHLGIQRNIPEKLTVRMGNNGRQQLHQGFELCGTRESSSKHHRLVTLGSCRSLDGLEKVILWSPSRRLWRSPEIDCERSLCSPRRSGEEQLY